MDDAASVNHRPDGKWQFDQEVTDCFDDMLARSIPQYSQMRAAVTDLAIAWSRPGTAIVDLGCSRGAAIAPLIERLGTENFFVGVETSPPMLEAARQRFAGYIKCGMADIRDCDLRTNYPKVKASVTLAILTLQFVPIEHRQQVVELAYEQTIPGGVMIVVEKILGATAQLDRQMVRSYHEMKHANGYSRDAIEAKRESLQGVLVPVTAQWNVDMLKTAGFRQVDCFWRWMNFAGWIAVK